MGNSLYTAEIQSATSTEPTAVLPLNEEAIPVKLTLNEESSLPVLPLNEEAIPVKLLLNEESALPVLPLNEEAIPVKLPESVPQVLPLNDDSMNAYFNACKTLSTFKTFLNAQPKDFFSQEFIHNEHYLGNPLTCLLDPDSFHTFDQEEFQERAVMIDYLIHHRYTDKYLCSSLSAYSIWTANYRQTVQILKSIALEEEWEDYYNFLNAIPN